ncbi:hypothetical protein EVAR_31997_1 [Eumeta japonica]|uniref:Uncharacterized protein n=1 Tax=Eumeta variegata TaxID=151549 RepID=A0A4C1VU47_EUMVA|nr:hypothetical protein EVAR_31997_1 [Eumeta japonica]
MLWIYYPNPNPGQDAQVTFSLSLDLYYMYNLLQAFGTNLFKIDKNKITCLSSSDDDDDDEDDDEDDDDEEDDDDDDEEEDEEDEELLSLISYAELISLENCSQGKSSIVGTPACCPAAFDKAITAGGIANAILQDF